jgi:hypothetical protein
MLWQLLLRQHISLLADPVVADTGPGHRVTADERVGGSEVSSLSQEASTVATDSRQTEATSHQPGLERRSSQPDHMPAVEWWVEMDKRNHKEVLTNLVRPLTPFVGQKLLASTFLNLLAAFCFLTHTSFRAYQHLILISIGRFFAQNCELDN